tara:strand:- start:1053 stop:2078 length:1026 start_codon:yes stop_codon:yes gene_type:complete
MGASLSALSGTITKAAVTAELDKMRDFINGKDGIEASDVAAGTLTHNEITKPVVRGFPVGGMRAETQQIYGRKSHPEDITYLDVGANYTSYLNSATIVPLIGKNRFGINCGAVEKSMPSVMHYNHVAVGEHHNIVPISPSICTVSCDRPSWINVTANWEYVTQINFRGDDDDGTWTGTGSSNDANESADPDGSGTGVAYPNSSINDLATEGEYMGYFALFATVKENLSGNHNDAFNNHWIELPGSRRWCLPQRVQDFKHSNNSGSNNRTTLVNQATGTTYLEAMAGIKSIALTTTGMGLFNICLGWVSPSHSFGACFGRHGAIWVGTQNLVIELHYNDNNF